MKRKPLLLTLSLSAIWTILSIIAIACTTETYDTGDGSLSYLRADFVEVFTNSSAVITEAVTDDDERLRLEKPIKVSWAETPDSTYRALLYYNKVGNTVKPVSISNVLVPTIRKASGVEEYHTDPLQFDSSWRSANGKYINMGLTVKAGTEDGNDAKQEIGVVCREIITHEDGTRDIHLVISHNQNDVPQYYSVSTYLSIPFASIPCDLHEEDNIIIEINTYDGKITKVF